MAKMFGIDIPFIGKKSVQGGLSVPATSVVDKDDIVVSHGGGINAIGVLAASTYNDAGKIQQYREIANTVYADMAITEYENESFVFNDITSKPFTLSFYDGTQQPESLQSKIIKEANHLYNVLNIRENVGGWYRDFYVDGRLVFNVLVNEDKQREGVLGVVQLDPLSIQKVQVIPEEDEQGNIKVKDVKNYYVYTENKVYDDISSTTYYTQKQSVDGIIIDTKRVVYVKSGLRDAVTGRTISYIDKSIVPYNNLKMMEDAMSIYRIVRAPMRRAFFVDTSMLQPSKAEAYMKQMKEKFEVKVSFDPNTGSITGKKGIMSILEDYWIPRQSGTPTTEVQNIEGGSTQDIIEEVEYYRNKYWDSLAIPKSRFQEQATFAFNRSGEIQRDEYRFHKNMSKIRNRMMTFFIDILGIHLELKGIIKEYEWAEIKSEIVIHYAEDNMYAEYKDAEKLNSTLDILDRISQHTNTYYSMQWVKDNVLKQNEEQQKKIAAEQKTQPKEEDYD